MAIKKAIYQVDNGTDFDEIHFKTSAEQVLMPDGSDVKTSILNNINLANQALTKANEAFQRGDNVKTQLVDKLISEGLDVSTNNTFEELIGNIALGGKWASGSFSSVGTKSITITNLDFKPNFVICSCPQGNVISFICSDMSYLGDSYNNKNYLFYGMAVAGSSYALGSNQADIYDDGFKIYMNVYNTSTYRSCFWFAFKL